MQVIERAIRLLQQDGNSRFEIIDKSKDQEVPKTTYNRAGFRELTDGKWIYYVFLKVFEEEIIQGANKKKACSALVEKGLLTIEADNKHYPKLKRLPGEEKSQRLYWMHLSDQEQ